MNATDIHTITATAVDWWECACRNNPAGHGFALTDHAGRDFDETPDEWPGRLYLCRSCGLVIDAHTVDLTARTVVVVGRIPTEHHR